jgi:hypothetical protein
MVDLFKASSADGDWFPYGKDGQIKVRRIPGPKSLEIDIKHFGKSWQFQQRGGMQQMTVSREQQLNHSIESASFALLDVKNVNCPGHVLSGLDGFDPAAMVALEGKLTAEVKTRILTESDDLRAAVLKAAGSLVAKTVKEEEELGKT